MKAWSSENIPEPVYARRPAWVQLYWSAWRLAAGHVAEREGVPQSPYMDEGFDRNTVWIWDTCFMAAYCKYAPERFPGVESFENFYGPLHEGKSSTLVIQHPDNPPLFAWLELEHARFTGNLERLRSVWSRGVLQKHDAFFQHQPPPRTQTHPAARYHNDLHWTGTGFLWSGVASGMDNTPRGRGGDPHGIEGHERILWFDALAQQALSARCLAEIADLVGDPSAAEWRRIFAERAARLNDLHWCAEEGIYHDVLAESPGEFVRVKTPAAYWPLLAGVCTPVQAEALAKLAADPRVFGGGAPWPSVSRDDPAYDPSGGYWRGGVWLPLAYMATKALERNGHAALADAHARALIDHMCRTWREVYPHTIWEAYAPEAPRPATDKEGGGRVRPDFCGWSALGPVSLFLENVLGFREISGLTRTVVWDCPDEPGSIGIRNLRFGGVCADLLYKNGKLTTATNLPFTLVFRGERLKCCP
ncbi:MAG: glycoside hydrolase family 37 [Verrucomicrobia bacterium]|nr:glycoside hydrolase family 37 [Verrucomicrobiota bacterium]MCH8526199.1 glycoside hydrolase family 37 [Kiritimatiellia bacterium]